MTWRTSSHCADSTECVEAGRLPSGAVGIRDNTVPAAEVHFTPMEWVAFHANIRRGLYDPPQPPPV